jgi:hypothetical protein
LETNLQTGTVNLVSGLYEEFEEGLGICGNNVTESNNNHFSYVQNERGYVTNPLLNILIDFEPQPIYNIILDG